MTSKNLLSISNQKQKTNPQFYENNILKEFIDIKISSPNKSIEKIDTTFQAKDKVISQIKSENNPDSDYNYKKDFLDLSFDQTKDSNNLGYKRKILSNKLMTDLTFSLNKDFEFTFQDKIKNNIISTLSKNNINDNNNKNKDIFNLNNIDNDFILDLCNSNNNLNFKEDNLLEESIDSSNSNNENSDNFLGLKKSQEEIENILTEDEIEHAKKNYTPVHCVHIALNYEEDEEFDIETFNFFLNFIKKYEEKPISSKIKLVLSYINEKNPETGKDIYSNKSKNKILQFWKREYDIARNNYIQLIKEEEKRKKELKLKQKSNKKNNKYQNINDESNYNKNNYISNSNYFNSENKNEENSLNSNSGSNISSGKYLKYVEIKNNNLKKIIKK